MASAPTDDLSVEQVDYAQRAIEYCYEQGWTDGLPIVPATEEMVRAFVAYSGRDAREVIATVEHLDRTCTVELAAANAIMAGCRIEYFPVVLAAVQAFDEAPSGAGWAWPQSTTGQAQLIIVSGPIRERLGFNSTGNVFGSGFRANATVGRSIRLLIMNALGIRPHEFDQSTQGTPAKYSFCIAENEEESPWEPLHVEKGFLPEMSTVTAVSTRNTLHVENRESEVPEEVLATIADSMSYAGSGQRQKTYVIVMGPEHAKLLARNGWSKQDVRKFLWERWGRYKRDLRRFGFPNTGGGLVGGLEHEPDDSFIRFGATPDSILVLVAGAQSAGLTTVIPSAGSFHTVQIAEPADT